MILYHGSNIAVREPSLSFSRRTLDFGAGFYLTSDLEQAARWAGHVTRLQGKGVPIVSAYETDEKRWEKLNILKFGQADGAWLDFVVRHRLNRPEEEAYDVVTGPIANDKTVDVITQYIAGSFPEDIALRLLLPMKLKDQWTLKTEKALAAIGWIEEIRV